MGRVHKKKLAEYAEAAENEEQQKNNIGEKEDDEKSAVEAADDKSSSESEADVAESVKIAKAAKEVVEDEGVEDHEEVDGNDDFHSLHGDDEEVDKNGSAKKVGTKRKAVLNAAKKPQEDGADGGDSDDEPINGGGSSSAKRGRKSGSGKGKGKAAKAGGRGRPKASKKQAAEEVDDEEEEEEEYEVKDIMDHKVERGATLYLIRWKGYTKDDDTWEPEDTLSCPDIIEKYKKKAANNGSKASHKKKVSSPAKKGGRGSATKSSVKEDPNKEWEVDKIVDYSVEKAGRVFRIRWKGFGPKNDTWEPEKNLYCNDLIEKFMQRMDSQKNISFKELREEPKKTKRLVNETAPRTNYHNAIGRKSKRGVSKKRVYYGDDE